MTFLGDAIMDLLVADAIPAYNMCAHPLPTLAFATTPLRPALWLKSFLRGIQT